MSLRFWFSIAVLCCATATPTRSAPAPSDPGAPEWIRCADSEAECGCQHVVRHRLEPDRHCRSHRAITPTGRYRRMTWAVLPIPPRSSSVAIKDEDVVRSIERASRTWSKNCGLAEAPDLVSVVASPPAADQAILLKWESLDRIRNSAFSLREAIACFNPYLDDSCAMVGGWLYMARDPVIGVRRGELVHTESATWLTTASPISSPAVSCRSTATASTKPCCTSSGTRWGSTTSRTRAR